MKYKSLQKGNILVNQKGNIICEYLYESLYDFDFDDPLQRYEKVKIEGTSFTVSEPIMYIEIAPCLYELAYDTEKEILRNIYDIKPFVIGTITLERIFIDKIFASQFYYERDDFFDVSKHIYDLSAGSITLQTYDDGLHADGGTLLGDGTKGAGTINISGGSVSMSVYSPENKTAGGRMGPGGRQGGWGGQQTVSGADGIHADCVLNISGGEVSIDSAYEGLEANVINLSGGRTVVAADDDGVNACKGSSTPAVNVTGGYLDVTVSPNGDTDGIDSNGTYKQTGGVVIARGPNNQNMAAIDADNSVSISGGTLIVLGYGRVSASGSVKKYTLSLHSAGSHTVTIGGESYTFTNASAYGSTTCYSDVAVSS